MIAIKKEGILLSKSGLAFESEGVCNPAAIRVGDSVNLYYRAVRKGNHSTVGFCRLEGPLTVADRWKKPLISPEFEYEQHGVEDPRIVMIEGKYYLTYTAFDGVNALGALAISDDGIHFEKKGILVPQLPYTEFAELQKQTGRVSERYHTDHQLYATLPKPIHEIQLWDKDVIFFPRKINGQFVFLHRIRPGIQLVAIEDLASLTPEYWKAYLENLQDHILLDPVYAHESKYIGGGCPPIETDSGWLMIYHGAEDTAEGTVYSACAAALLDPDDPGKVIARLPNALFAPEYQWEKKGVVNNVVFPTGTSIFGDTLFIYYGAADTRLACASVSLSGLLAEILKHKSPHENENHD